MKKPRELICDFCGQPARPDLQPYLQALDCSDLMELADMYGAARHAGDAKLMQAIDDRMSKVACEQGLVPPEAMLQAAPQQGGE